MILKYMRRRDWCLALVCAVFVVVQVYFDLRIPEYMSVITDIISQSGDIGEVYRSGLMMVVCTVCSIIISLVASGLAAKTATSLCFTLRARIFDKISGFSSVDAGRFSIESLITRCSGDVNQVEKYLAEALLVLVRAVAISVWCIVKTIGSAWQWTVVSIVGFALFILLIAFVNRSTRPFFRKLPALTDEINQSSLEHLTGLRTVRTYSAESFQEGKFEAVTDRMEKNTIGSAIWSAHIPAISSAAGNIITLSIFWAGMLMISTSTGDPQNAILFSQMVMFSSYVMLVVGSYVSVALMIQSISRRVESSRRIQGVIDYEFGIRDGSFAGTGPEQGTVEFRGVSFAYRGAPVDAVHDVSFKVAKGSTLAIIGATGSGKSTLANLLLRQYVPDSGTILVDGVDVTEYRGSVLRSKMGYVPQTSRLFTGTVESNVNFGSTRSRRTPADVRRALEIAQAAEFVDGMPEKEASRIEENGRNLSGGQRQRLSIARAVCRDAEILLLDDPFSALDYATDRSLRAALSEHCSGTTRILITQRVGTACDADEIIVLDKGCIVGRGKHDWLLENCSLYREYASIQMSEVAE